MSTTKRSNQQPSTKTTAASAHVHQRQHDRKRMLIGGAMTTAVVIGGLVVLGNRSTTQTDATQPATAGEVAPARAEPASPASRAPVRVPASVFPYLEVEGRGSIEDPQSTTDSSAQSERPLLLDGEAFADALADAIQSPQGVPTLGGAELLPPTVSIPAGAS